jgi:uncharacterized membrane protein
MSVTISHPTIARSASAQPLRFGAESGGADHAVLWLLRRNCSTTPRQMLMFFGSLCALSLGIGLFFWLQGATLVMPFAWVEVLAVGCALLIYSRHATDNENIKLQQDRLIVEYVFGRHVQRVEFAPAWVRIEPEHGDRSLIELSGQGQRIAVGRFIRPELRRQLAEELRWALRRWQWVPGSGANTTPADELQDKSEN